MSLIKKKYDEGGTELNKLKFKPFMTQGNTPLVTKRIPTEDNPTPPTSGQVQTRADDLSRIAILMTRPQGIKYLGNNTALNLAVDLSYTVQGTIGDKLKALNDINRGEAFNDTARTLGSTLAQVPVSGTGTHFIKGKLFGKPDTSFNKPSRTVSNLGDPGKVNVKYGRDPYYRDAPSDYGEDLLGMMGPYKSSAKASGYEVDDFIKFNFEVLTPGESDNVFLHFRAYLDSFNDSYNGSWNPIKYVGRGEQFYTYDSFTRQISVSFKSAVMTKPELKPMYQRLAYLASTTAPTYSENGIMRGTIVKMNIGDYLSDTPGYISNVEYSWETRFPFEVARGKKDPNAPRDISNTDLKVQELPHILNCSVTFVPIHVFTPQTGMYHYITKPETEDEAGMFKEGVVKTRVTPGSKSYDLDLGAGFDPFSGYA